jgi:hypothetical protein
MDCFRLEFVGNDELLLFTMCALVLQNFTQAVDLIDILEPADPLVLLV